MRSVDKLREWSRWLDNTYATDDGKSYNVYSYQPYDGMKSCGKYMREQCDEIEAEIAEQYQLLPVDADGVPIRVGDIMERVDGGPSQQACCICPGGFNDAPIWCARDFRHVKPRTLEDVLEEYYDKRGWDEADNCALNADELTARYAEEIRELLGGDAE